MTMLSSALALLYAVTYEGRDLVSEAGGVDAGPFEPVGWKAGPESTPTAVETRARHSKVTTFQPGHLLRQSFPQPCARGAIQNAHQKASFKSSSWVSLSKDMLRRGWRPSACRSMQAPVSSCTARPPS